MAIIENNVNIMANVNGVINGVIYKGNNGENEK